MKGIEYRGLSRIEGPVVIAARSRNVGFNGLSADWLRIKAANGNTTPEAIIGELVRKEMALGANPV